MEKKVVSAFPWQNRLPREIHIEHPTSLDAFGDWPQLDKTARIHLNYLEHCGDQLVQNWMDPWRDIYAVGPFLDRRRRYSAIPFVAIINCRRPYRHLLTLSHALSAPYLEFGILPDIFLLPMRAGKMLDEAQDVGWEKTRKVSVHWSKESRYANS
jgi:hypothetical protein